MNRHFEELEKIVSDFKLFFFWIGLQCYDVILLLELMIYFLFRGFWTFVLYALDYSSDTFLLLIIYFYCLSKKKKKEERKNMRNELQQQCKTKMSDTFKKPVNRSPTNESYLSIRIRVPHVQPYMNAYNLRIKSIKIVVKRHLMNDNNLQRSPTKFNYPSGFLWLTSQSS